MDGESGEDEAGELISRRTDESVRKITALLTKRRPPAPAARSIAGCSSPRALSSLQFLIHSTFVLVCKQNFKKLSRNHMADDNP